MFKRLHPKQITAIIYNYKIVNRVQNVPLTSINYNHEKPSGNLCYSFKHYNPTNQQKLIEDGFEISKK
jgi:hypothetical protein